MSRLKVTLLLVLSFTSLGLRAEVMVNDDLGNPVYLDQPASRIVSLAPHLTEIVFAAGAGDRLIGVVSYSDYPPEALNIPVIGSYNSINYEALVALQPDLVLVWNSGNGPELAERLEALGLSVFVSEPKRLPDIARSLNKIGILSGTLAEAEQAATEYLTRYQTLLADNRNKTPVNVFIELWHEPMMTVNGTHIISDSIELCGGNNIFADALPLVPRINVESVVRGNPNVIIATGMADERPEWLDNWLIWPDLSAVKSNSLYSINPDLIGRHSPRILQGVTRLCDYFDQTRKSLGLNPNKPIDGL
ncbi:cobalamin-binding protein [Porticoccaceae bacterium]|jgi:iron complex transport system substrate-binding protein|nr:cobalamin-binding protein [Porticoccaceae bacterium]